jgi:hypothetical protein
LDGAITSRFPSRTMLTSLTLSGKARLLGKRTACERFDLSRVSWMKRLDLAPQRLAYSRGRVYR